MRKLCAVSKFSLFVGMMLVCFYQPERAQAAGDAGVITIAAINTVSGYGVFIITAVPVNNPDNCGSSGQVIVSTSNPLYAQFMAQLTTAAAAGKPVQFWLEGCTSTPWGFTIPIATTAVVYYSNSAAPIDPPR